MDHFLKDRGENKKYLSCHHPGFYWIKLPGRIRDTSRVFSFEKKCLLNCQTGETCHPSLFGTSHVSFVPGGAATLFSIQPGTIPIGLSSYSQMMSKGCPITETKRIGHLGSITILSFGEPGSLGYRRSAL